MLKAMLILVALVSFTAHAEYSAEKFEEQLSQIFHTTRDSTDLKPYSAEDFLALASEIPPDHDVIVYMHWGHYYLTSLDNNTAILVNSSNNMAEAMAKAFNQHHQSALKQPTYTAELVKVEFRPEVSFRSAIANGSCSMALMSAKEAIFGARAQSRIEYQHRFGSY